MSVDIHSVPNTPTQAPSSSGSIGPIAEEMIRKRIMHTLWIYPKLSHSMLQIGIGTGFPPALWHPVLERLVQEGQVRRHQVRATNPVSKRDQVYTILEHSHKGPRSTPTQTIAA